MNLRLALCTVTDLWPLMSYYPPHMLASFVLQVPFKDMHTHRIRNCDMHMHMPAGAASSAA